MEKTVVKKPVKVNTKLLTADKKSVQPKPKIEIPKKEESKPDVVRKEEPVQSPIDFVQHFCTKLDVPVSRFWNKNHYWTATLKKHVVSLYSCDDRVMKNNELSYVHYIILDIDGETYSIDAEKIAEMIIALVELD